MRKKLFLISAFVLISALTVAGVAFAAPPQGLLMDQNGLPLKGYSNVYIVDGKALPVYSADDQLWHMVFVTGTAPDGTALCILGPAFGIDENKDANEDAFSPGAPPAGPKGDNQDLN